MRNFEHYNPVSIVFGEKGIDSSLSNLVERFQRIFICSGEKSAETSGVLPKIRDLLGAKVVGEHKGIGPNPDIENLQAAAASCRSLRADFVLAVGGGSVLDGVKLIVSQAVLDLDDPWEIVKSQGRLVSNPLAFGSILTLSATGSETNPWAVISKRSTGEKMSFGHPSLFPLFSIIDPQLMMTLPVRQVINGIIDPFVHVMEQYLTFPVNAKLQERQAEAVLSVLIEEGPRVLRDLNDLPARKNMIWAASNALNGMIGLGVPQDWSTHMIGHELTARYGLDHAQSLAVVLPGVMKIELDSKRRMLEQYGKRVLGLVGSNVAEQAIIETRAFFKSLGAATKLSDYQIPKSHISEIASRLNDLFPMGLGENKSIKLDKINAILSEVYE